MLRNELAVFLKSKVPGVEQMKLDILEIALIGMGTLGRENKIIFAPNDKRGWLVGAEIFLPRRI